MCAGRMARFKLPLYLMIMTADEVAYFKNGGILPTSCAIFAA